MKPVKLFPSARAVIGYITCLILCGTLCLLMSCNVISDIKRGSEFADDLPLLLFSLLPFIIGALAFISLMKLRSISVEEDKLILKSLLLFKTTTYEIKDINEIVFRPYKIGFRRSMNSPETEIYQGREVILYLNERRLKFNSFEYSRFQELRYVLLKSVNSLDIKPGMLQKRRSNKSFNWLLFYFSVGGCLALCIYLLVKYFQK